jgi:hypothetical protein
METNIWFWIGFNAFIILMLALDLGVFHRKAHDERDSISACEMESLLIKLTEVSPHQWHE